MEKVFLIQLPTLKALETLQGIDPDGFMDDGILIGDGKLMSITRWACLTRKCDDVPQSSTDKEQYWVLPLDLVRKYIKDKTGMLIKFDGSSAQSNGVDLKLKNIKLHFLFEDMHPEQPTQFNIQLPILALMHRAAKHLGLGFAHYRMVDEGRYLCWWQNEYDWYGTFMGHRSEDRISWEERQAILDIMAGKEPLF